MTAKELIEQTYWVRSGQASYPTMKEVIKKMEEYGKQQWNEAIDAAVENAKAKGVIEELKDPMLYTKYIHYVIDKESILKLKKK